LDGGLRATECQEFDTRTFFGGGERASRPWGSHGSYVGSAGGRSSDGAPRFDQTVNPGGYLWWYVDALSDDGQLGLTIIAFVGSVFSPYYRWANQRSAFVDPNNYCCLNVALYSKQHHHWAMTERGAGWCDRGADYFSIGPSQLQWDGQALHIDVREMTVPWAQTIEGRVSFYPDHLFNFGVNLDPQHRHMWGPLAPSGRVTVQMKKPNLSWQGHAYLDSNEGSEAIEKPFQEWDWSRSRMANGDVAVMYDVQLKGGASQVLAYRFDNRGGVSTFEAPDVQHLRKTAWRIPRRMRSDGPVAVTHQLEDTPFYQRAMLRSSLLGETVDSFHETLNVPRLSSTAVQMMLPWRMPRRA
jgi:carotenoid 1,2-hydratase